ncbi:MAG: FAD-dependent oxidoreductase [Nitrososphaerota archaeon]
MPHEIGILGGGLSGLLLGNLLGPRAEVLEAETEVGGLCRSFYCDGFTFDIGGHMIFSRDPDSLALLISFLNENVHCRLRVNRILFKDRYMKYPFENDLASLDKEDLFNALYHYLTATGSTSSNFKSWLYHTFGKGIAELYLIPYNRKIWKIDPSEMSTIWVERIPRPPLEDIIKSAIGIPTEGYVHQLYFHYPIRGGIGALPQSLLMGANVIPNFRIAKIIKNSGYWEIISDNEEIKKYKYLISTIPLPELVLAQANVPEEIKILSDQLQYNSLIVAFVGFVGEHSFPPFTALYSADPEIIFHRFCFMEQFSEKNAPPKGTGIIGEATFPGNSPELEKPDEYFLSHLIQFCDAQKWIGKATLVTSKVIRVKYAYVVPNLTYPQVLEQIHQYFAKNGIVLAGRFGRFEYLNMDAVLQNALKVKEIFQ